MKLEYQPHIDGLRAVAVMSVILYHAGISVIPGGFVGVDIFFVISGYLITSIIWKEIVEGRFNYATFYERRIRRLIPPLIPVLMVTSIGSFLLLSQTQFDDFVRSLQATLLFSANWHFLSTVGYFALDAELKPLLHMWSLAVEEQYYLVFPAIMLVLARLRSALPALIIVLLAASLSLAVWFMAHSETELAFFNSLARFWEMMVGSLLAFIHRRPTNRVVASVFEAVALVLIAVPIFTYGPNTPFPGLAALPPVLGTALVIFAGGNGFVISPILKLRPVLGVGLISYALYLWHWPLLVFLHVVYPDAPLAWSIGALSLTLALAILSFFTIEQPIRKKRVLATRPAMYGMLVLVTCFFLGVATATMLPPRETINERVRTALLGEERSKALETIALSEDYYQSKLNINFNGKSPPEDATELKAATCSYDGGNTVDRLVKCIVAKAVPESTLVIGDSQGRDAMWALRVAFPRQKFLMLHQSSCPPADHTIGQKSCFPELSKVLSQALAAGAKFDKIVIAFRYRPDEWTGVEPFLSEVRNYAPNIVMIGPTPFYGTSLPNYVKANMSLQPKVPKSDASMFKWDLDALTVQARAMAQKYSIPFIASSNAFCDFQGCAVWDQTTGSPLIWDQGHLTQEGMRHYAKFLEQYAALGDATL